MLTAACERLIAVETGGDDDAFEDVFDAVGVASVEEMTEAVRLFPPISAAHPLSVVNNLLIPAVSMVQRGADLPSDLVDVLTMRVADGLERAAGSLPHGSRCGQVRSCRTTVTRSRWPRR